MHGRRRFRKLFIASAVALWGLVALPWMPAAQAHGVLLSIAVTPNPANVPIGVTTQFTATGTYLDGHVVDITNDPSVNWTSSVPATATVNNVSPNKGKVTGVAQGATTITAASGTISGVSVVTVVPATLLAITVTPNPANVPIGVTTQFTATGTYSDATTQNLTSAATWSSSVPATATVNDAAPNKGKVTGVATGVTTITAAVTSISGASVVTVVPATLVAITVDPVAPSIAKGTTQQFTATGHFSDLNTLDMTTDVVWSSSDPAVATISNANGSRGLATGVDLGPTVITATDPGTSLAGVAALTVTAPVLVAINVTPPATTVARGSSAQLTAEGTYSDLTTAPLTDSLTWASTSPTIATVSDTVPTKGLVTGVTAGATTITATDPGSGIAGVAGIGVTPYVPLPQLYITDVTVNEPEPGETAIASFSVALSAPSAVPVTVTVATGNSTASSANDYVALTATPLTFLPNQLVATADVTINGDDFRERNENYFVRLTAPVGATLGDDTGIGRILDPLGKFNVFVRDTQVVQSPTALTTAHFAVELNATPLPGETVTVQVATADLSATVAANDYAALGPITLTFNSTTGNSIDVAVTVRKTTPGEGIEQFKLVVTSPSVNVQVSDGFGLATIYNGAVSPAPSITIQDPRILENFSASAVLTYRIRLSKPTTQTVKVTYATTNDGATATPGSDYVPLPPTEVTFLPNETLKTVLVTVFGDIIHERVETVNLTLSKPVNASIGDAQGVGRIRDRLGRFAVYVRDAETVQSPTSTTTARFVVSLSARPFPGESVDVVIATLPGSATSPDDYAALSQTITFGPNVLSLNVDVTVNPGAADEADEFFQLQLVSSSDNAKIADVLATGNISAGA